MSEQTKIQPRLIYRVIDKGQELDALLIRFYGDLPKDLAPTDVLIDLRSGIKRKYKIDGIEGTYLFV